MRKIFVVLCLAIGLSAHAATYALRGTVVTPQSVIANGIVVVDGDTIASVGTTAPKGTTVIDTGGIIFPGLIDLHNHVTWNAFPRWRAARAVSARYDWQADPDYLAKLSNPHFVVQGTNACDLERYGEVKALVNGATSIVGSLLNICSNGLIRNLDYAAASGFAGKNPALYQVFPLQLTEAQATSTRAALKAGDAYIVHLSEGVSESARRELVMLDRQGYLQPGLVAIHGVALKAADFQTLKKGGAGHVWSPRSNLELYGSTADINAARAAGLTIAISPDWSPSGSAGMIPEMTYAWRWIEDVDIPLTAQDLVTMATTNAATLGNVADRTGQIAPNLAADLLVVARDGQSDPYETLVETQPAGIKLVIVAGRPLYGDSALVKKVNPAAKTEPLTVCGAAKVIDMSDSDDGKGITWADTQAALTGAMGKLTPPIPLAALADCR
jgi:5-methylthioadenosine/S-adenosylhomocysteine deaminase